MTRILLVALLVLALVVPVAAIGETVGSSGVPPASHAAKKKKKKKCKKGYVRKKVKAKKGPKKGKKVSKCVKKKKKKNTKKPSAPLVPSDPDSGGVYFGGSGPTEMRILVGFDADAPPEDDSNGISLRLTFPAGSMQCNSTTNPGQKIPSNQDFRSNFDGAITSRKNGTFSGSSISGSPFQYSMSGRFLATKRIQAQVTLTNVQVGHSTGATCSGTATRDITYRPGVAGTFQTP